MQTETSNEQVVKSETVSVEFRTLDGNTSVNSWNGIPVSGLRESSGDTIIVQYELPMDKSTSAVLFALIGGSDLDCIYSHRSNAEGEVYLTIGHRIEGVASWNLESLVGTSNNKSIVEITYLVDSSILVGENEVTQIG